MSHHLCVFIDSLDLHLQLVDLTVVGIVRHRQVVHGEGPEGGVELRSNIIPHFGQVKRHDSLVHRGHHLLAGCDVLMDLLLLPVALLCLLQFVILGLMGTQRQQASFIIHSSTTNRPEDERTQRPARGIRGR